MICCYCFCIDRIYDLSKYFSYYLDMCFLNFFFFFKFLLSIFEISWVSLSIFWGRGAKYINFKAKKMLIYIYTMPLDKGHCKPLNISWISKRLPFVRKGRAFSCWAKHFISLFHFFQSLIEICSPFISPMHIPLWVVSEGSWKLKKLSSKSNLFGGLLAWAWRAQVHLDLWAWRVHSVLYCNYLV